MLSANVVEMFDHFQIVSTLPQIDFVRLVCLVEQTESHSGFRVFVELSFAESTSRGFYKIAQNRSSNLLQKWMTDRQDNLAQIDLNGNKTIVADGFKLVIEGYNDVGSISSNAALLLDCLMIKATEDGLKDTLVALPLEKYMIMRGLRDVKEARKHIKAAIIALDKISFECKGVGNQRGSMLTIKISGGTTGIIKNGMIIFRFNQDFFNSFKSYGNNAYLFMYFPVEALKGSIVHFPYKYWAARRISEHKRMNLGKLNENVISIKTLIAAFPNFPTYEQTSKSLNNRIIRPIERDLDALASVFAWEYIGGKPTSYNEFLSAKIKIHWKNYPDEAVDGLKTKKLERKIRKFKKGVAVVD